MSLSYSIDHVLTSVEDVSIEVSDKANMVLTGTSLDRKTGESVSTYVIANGDNAYPATVTYRSGVQTLGGRNVRRVSISFATWAVKTDSVTTAEVREPITATISLILPAVMTIESSDVDDLVGNLFSFLYPSVTTKVRATTWLAKLLYGVSQVS